MDLSTVTHQDFENVVNQDFSCHGEKATFTLTLDKVRISPDNRKPTPESRTPFSLFFKGKPEEHVVQNTYCLENATLGQLDIFIVPVAEDDKMCVTYQAVFN